MGHAQSCVDAHDGDGARPSVQSYLTPACMVCRGMIIPGDRTAICRGGCQHMARLRSAGVARDGETGRWKISSSISSTGRSDGEGEAYGSARAALEAASGREKRPGIVYEYTSKVHRSTKDAAVLDVCETMAPPHASEVAPASSTQARPVAECTADVASSTSTSSKTKTKTRRGQKPRPDVNTSELMRRTRLKRVRSAEKMRKKMLRRADTDVLSVPGYDPRHFSVNSTRGEWSVVVDDRNGKTMYYNPSTREMRATRPEGWVRMLAKTATPG